MLYQQSNQIARRRRASVLPFVVVSVFLLFVTLGISTDFMRDFETASQLNFAAQSAALYALSLATNSDGSYSTNSAQTNISTAIINAGSAAWNAAQFGPQNNIWSKPVSFSSADIQFVNNPLDLSEFFVQLTASRQGPDALIQFFLPLAYANFNNTALPLSQVSPIKIVEVFGQPATRIGAGVPAGVQPGTRNADFAGFATLPFAISNLQFAAASTSAIGTTFTIDLVSSSTTTTSQPGHIKGCFVNVCASGNNTSNYYGSAQGSQAFTQLIALLTYFVNGNSATTPANVECGSLLSAFDPNSLTTSQQAAISQIAAQLPNSFYIIPVLLTDPNFTSNNTVLGFARMRLDAINTTGGAITSLTMDIGESVPLRNASSATGFSTVSNTANTPMPASVYPFLPRQYDYSSGGITPRPTGVVLAPALSPRIIKPS